MDNPQIPPADPDSAPFFAGCSEGVLRIQQCAETGRLIFPPRPMSPFAPHVAPTWTTVSVVERPSPSVPPSVPSPL